MTADLDRKLACMPDNPKRPQTKSWERYEKYKAATTVGEFLDLGGTLADLAHDTGKGFVQYADKKSHKPPNFPRAAAQKAPLSAEEKAWQTWDDDELDDVCDTCGEYTTHLRCSGLLRMPPDDEGYRCVNCVDGTSGGEVDRPARAAPRRDDADARAAQLSGRCLKCGGAGALERELYFCEVAGCYGCWHGDCADALLPAKGEGGATFEKSRCPSCADRFGERAHAEPAAVGRAEAPRTFWAARCLRNYHLKRETTGKKRGRPKGSVNKPRGDGLPAAKKPRGRRPKVQPPPGSLNLAALGLPGVVFPPAPPGLNPGLLGAGGAADPRLLAAHQLQLHHAMQQQAALHQLHQQARAFEPAAPAPAAPAAPPAEAQKDCAPVGDGWWEKKDPASGRCYYVHESTGACQWEKPVAKPPQSPSFH
ncbi:hypothetical protein JL722_6598 [Aureococcus anophagefferens]|nr:hypothetical protein JL722_6598 [Aureococcus anophagefferens]